jgi:hypothetical protein
MTCYACGRELSNDHMARNFGYWTYGPVDGQRQAYCADNAFCRDVTLHAEAGVAY